MRGGREPGTEPVRDRAGGPARAFLCQAAGGQSGGRVERTGTCRHRTARSCEPEERPGACAASCPDPGALGSAWGEFEGFRESSAKPGFPPAPDLERRTEPQPPGSPSGPEERGSPRPHRGPWVKGAAALPAAEPLLSYESVFRFAFPEVTAEQATGDGDVCSLDHFLDASSEGHPGPASAHRLRSESRKLWRALQGTCTMPTWGRPWSESRCQESLFVILGIDAAQKSPCGDQGLVLEGPAREEPEDLLASSSCPLQPCRALIQTQLSGTASSGQGSLIAYSLFLKTPLHGNGHYITVPQKKKIFTPRKLKLAFFNNGIC